MEQYSSATTPAKDIVDAANDVRADAAGSNSLQKHVEPGAFASTIKAKDVNTILRERGIEDLFELLPLSWDDLRAQFSDLDPLSYRRLQDAIRYAKTQPEWLHRERRQVFTAMVVGGLILLAWLIGRMHWSFLWAILIAAAIMEGWRRMTDAYHVHVAHSARRQASKMQAEYFGETAEWLNVFIRDAWRMGQGDNLGKIIMESANDALEAQDLGSIQHLSISAISLGHRGFSINKIQTLPSTNELERSLDAILSFVEDNSMIELKISISGVHTKVQLRGISIHTHARFWLKFNPGNAEKDPFLETVHMSLLSKPEVDFGIFPLGKFDLLKAFPSLDRWVHSLVIDCLSELFLEPERLAVYADDPNYWEADEEANGLLSGVLLIEILEGRDIKSTHHTKRKHGKKKRHAIYAKISTPYEEKTTRAEYGPNPMWKIQHVLRVQHTKTDKITVEVFDRRLGLKPKLLGKARFRTDSLTAKEGHRYSFTMDMFDRVGTLDLVLTYAPLAQLPSRFLPPAIATQRSRKRDLGTFEEKKGDQLDQKAVADKSKEKAPSRTTEEEGEPSASPATPTTTKESKASIEEKDEQLLATLSALVLPDQTPPEQAAVGGARRASTLPPPVPGILFVRIHEGRGLISMDRTGKSDPFCTVRYNGRKLFTSPTMPQTLDPDWDSVLEMHKGHVNWKEVVVADIRNAFVEFRLYDYDHLSANEYMGTATVRLFPSAMESGVGVMNSRSCVLIDKWLPLTSTKGKLSSKRGLGEIRVSVVFRPVDVNPTRFCPEDYLGAMDSKHTAKYLKADKKKKGKKPCQLHPENFPNGGKLSVSVLRGRSLQAKDRSLFGGRSSDPYIVVKVEDVPVFKTEVISKTLNPAWNASFATTIKDKSKEKTVSFECFDHDLVSKDDAMGSVAISLTDERCSGDPIWLALSTRGEIQVQIRFTPTASLLSTSSTSAATETAKKGSHATISHIHSSPNISLTQSSTNTGAVASRKLSHQPVGSALGHIRERSEGSDMDASGRFQQRVASMPSTVAATSHRDRVSSLGQADDLAHSNASSAMVDVDVDDYDDPTSATNTASKPKKKSFGVGALKLTPHLGLPHGVYGRNKQKKAQQKAIKSKKKKDKRRSDVGFSDSASSSSDDGDDDYEVDGAVGRSQLRKGRASSLLEGGSDSEGDHRAAPYTRSPTSPLPRRLMSEDDLFDMHATLQTPELSILPSNGETASLSSSNGHARFFLQSDESDMDALSSAIPAVMDSSERKKKKRPFLRRRQQQSSSVDVSECFRMEGRLETIHGLPAKNLSIKMSLWDGHNQHTSLGKKKLDMTGSHVPPVDLHFIAPKIHWSQALQLDIFSQATRIKSKALLYSATFTLEDCLDHTGLSVPFSNARVQVNMVRHTSSKTMASQVEGMVTATLTAARSRTSSMSNSSQQSSRMSPAKLVANQHGGDDNDAFQEASQQPTAAEQQPCVAVFSFSATAWTGDSAAAEDSNFITTI